MRKLFTLFFLTLLISCEDDDLGLKSNPIDSKIIIETIEILEPNSRRLTLSCKTAKIYPCINFPILTEQQTIDNSIKIDFTSIGESILCFTALGPARTIVDLNSLPNGEYSIELNNARLKNKGTLKLTDTDISLVFGIKNGIDIERANTKRVPVNTYWGTIGYHVESSSTLVDEFIQKFTDIGAVFSKQSPGHYFYYEINNSGAIVNNVENSGYYFMKTFIFQFDGNETELKNLIQIDGKDYKTDLSINVQTYKGEQINNWDN
jgi:hypothetical protein